MIECINHEENNKISTYKYQLLLECNPIIRQIYIYICGIIWMPKKIQ